ncbi:MAG: thioredoxin [Dysgonamonadaceae bacterium]|jgi:thioredoxin 1|nr:thioredoxin [Dysgonamonadaceae bacterium]MDD3495491.1 thioredoxin [Dysgonamonadaceae bacterium]NLH28800.1 thioredoxin [Bacteroidales bacterium]HXK99850.1 thioredoxin [Dysgonamonadaceae bacterium]
MVLQITDATLDKVLKTDKPVVIDFWAEWCGPCRMVAPIIEQLAEEYKDNVIVGKIDVDENNEATTKYGIRNIPTILFIKNGQVVDKIVGAADKRLFVDKINKLL